MGRGAVCVGHRWGDCDADVLSLPTSSVAHRFSPVWTGRDRRTCILTADTIDIGGLMTARTISRLAAALCGVTLAALGVTAPAHAEDWQGRDAARDVAAKKCRPDCDYTPAPGVASADMVRISVNYRHDEVRIAVKLRGVDRSKAFALTSLLATTDREGRYFSVISAFAPGRAPDVHVRNPSGIAIGCGAATTSLKGDRILTTVPARCINKADWVRWSGYMRVIFPEDVDVDQRYSGWFDKFRTSSSTPLNKNTYEFSRKIRRA